MRSIHLEEPTTIFALAAQPGGRCLAATEEGLWQFANGAWQQIAPQFAQVQLSAIAANGNTIFVGAAGDIAVSRDGGQTFGLATLPVKAHIMALAMSPAFAQDYIALAATAQDGVLRSADGGSTWHAWNYGLLDLGVNAIAFSPSFAQDATCFAATDHGIFISTNSGRAWSELPVGMDNGPFTALALRNKHTQRSTVAELVTSTEGNGVWTAGEPFEAWQKMKGLRASEVNFLMPNAAMTTQGIFVADGGKWVKALDEAEGVCAAQLDDGGLMIGTAGNGCWLLASS